MTMSDEPSSVPPTRAVRSQSEIAPTAAMRGSAPGELPATSLNYSPRARATSGRKWLPDNLRAQVSIVDVLCVFRGHPASDSESIRPPIPILSGH